MKKSQLLPGEAVELTVSVIDGAGYTLNIVADGEVVEQYPVNGARVAERFSVVAGKYIRCELVGDMPRDQLPPDVPGDVDLRDWRWALSNPIYLACRR